MLRRLVLTFAASAAALSAVPAAPATALPATALPATAVGSPTNLGSVSTSGLALMPPPARDEDSRDRLTVTVHDSGSGADGTYELRCHPDGGSHPDVSGACGALDRGLGGARIRSPRFRRAPCARCSTAVRPPRMSRGRGRGDPSTPGSTVWTGARSRGGTRSHLSFPTFGHSRGRSDAELCRAGQEWGKSEAGSRQGEAGSGQGGATVTSWFRRGAKGTKCAVTASASLLRGFYLGSACDLPLIRRRERNLCP